MDAVSGGQALVEGIGPFHAYGSVAYEDAAVAPAEHGGRAAFGVEHAHVGGEAGVDEGFDAAGLG